MSVQRAGSASTPAVPGGTPADRRVRAEAGPSPARLVADGARDPPMASCSCTIVAPAAPAGCVRSDTVLSFIVRLIVNGLALWVATEVIDGVTITSDSTSNQILTLLVVALIFGVVNAVIKPIVQLLSLPLLIVTLGLFTFIVNALMFWLTSGIADLLDVPFHVDGFFWEAVLGALVVSFVSWLLNLLLPT